jgi:hypothetical protein
VFFTSLDEAAHESDSVEVLNSRNCRHHHRHKSGPICFQLRLVFHLKHGQFLNRKSKLWNHGLTSYIWPSGVSPSITKSSYNRDSFQETWQKCMNARGLFSFRGFAHLLTRCLHGEALTVENLSVIGQAYTPDVFTARWAQPRTRSYYRNLWRRRRPYAVGTTSITVGTNLSRRWCVGYADSCHRRCPDGVIWCWFRLGYRRRIESRRRRWILIFFGNFNFFRKSLHWMSFHVRFACLCRSNELGHSLDHGIICQNNPISDTCVALGTMMNVTEPIFYFVPRKVYFLFLKCQNRVFYCEGATETIF